MTPHYASTVAVPGAQLQVSRLGFGCARLHGGLEAGASRGLIEAALACGLRHFDTAPAYPSESMLGEVLAGVRDVTIATKVGLSASQGQPSRVSVAYRLLVRPVLARVPALKSRLLRRTARNRPGDSRVQVRRLERSEVERSLEASLRRLRRDKVHLLLLHEPDQFLIDDELRSVFSDLKHQGLCLAYGLAYGRALDAAPSFGSVLQAQYDDTVLKTASATTLRIWHGVARGGAAPGANTIPVGKRIASVLAKSADAVIFSASARTQIHQVVRSVAGAQASDGA